MNKLREQNKLMIYEFTKLNNAREVTKQRIIKELLKYDDCFQRLSFEEGCTILKNLRIQNWKEVYAKLLSLK